jgi:type IV pilus assembly protein PilE
MERRIPDMFAPNAGRNCRARHQGFSLIELMIAVAVVGILLAVALPSYQGSVRKGRRAEAINAINAVQQAQERSRANFATYCDNDHLSTAPTASQCGLKVPATTASGYYTVAIGSSPTGTSYTVTATAAGSQASDTKCKLMAAKIDNGAISYGSGESSVDWADTNRCWAK